MRRLPSPVGGRQHGRRSESARQGRRRSDAPGGRRPDDSLPGRLRRLVSGNRAYAVSLVALLLLLGVMAVGPVQNFTAAGDRVDELAASRDQLAEEVAALEERREQLQDPEEVELIARSRLGLVKPGEIPYVVVVEEPDLDELGPGAGEREGQPFLERLVEALRDLLD